LDPLDPEQFHFPFTNVYNADIVGGHCRDRFDVILIPDMPSRSIMDGHRPGTIPERYAGASGIRPDELRDFVRDGGTLITFNNASQFAIDQFKLPVENALPAAAGAAGEPLKHRWPLPQLRYDSRIGRATAAHRWSRRRSWSRSRRCTRRNPATGAAFFCSGCLLKIHVEDSKNLSSRLAVRSHRDVRARPAFDTKADFKGTVLAATRAIAIL